MKHAPLWLKITLGLVAALACALLALRLSGHWGAAKELAGIVVMGSSRDLRERSAAEAPRSPKHGALLILALDGVDRSLLYELLRSGELPNLAALLGEKSDQNFPNVYFDETRLATLPSITMAAWTTAFTGTTPSHHGIVGNEFFVREKRKFVAPAPVSINAPELSMKAYTEDYLGDHILVPTVYEQMRARDPQVLIWVAMSHVYRGADKLIITSRVALVDAFATFFAELAEEVAGEEEDSSALYAKVDEEVIEEVVVQLKKGPVPDVLTVYLPGTDLYAHVATEGPNEARRMFLREKVDPEIGKLSAALRARGALADRYVVVFSDHGHSQVKHDDRNALSMGDTDDPPALLRAIGLRPRPFEVEVADDDDFDSVLAYQGAMAFVYLADRSACAQAKEVCNFAAPPRMEDVMHVAEAFYRNNEDGSIVPAMRGTLDLVLIREPRGHGEIDLPFRVYVGAGESLSIGEYLRDHPRKDLVEFESRLEELAVGPVGERAGDVLLLSKYGLSEDHSSRFYFAGKYESWHGSPNAPDSEIPFIVAHPGMASAELASLVRRASKDQPWQWRIADILLGLRYQD